MLILPVGLSCLPEDYVNKGSVLFLKPKYYLKNAQYAQGPPRSDPNGYSRAERQSKHGRPSLTQKLPPVDNLLQMKFQLSLM